MPSLALPILLAIGAGVSIVVQQVLNSNLRTALNSAAWSGFMSYLVGVVCMALLALALRDPIPSASVAAPISWWAWSGGLFGAIFIGLSILLVPQLSSPSLSQARCWRQWPSITSAGSALPSARSTCRA